MASDMARHKDTWMLKDQELKQFWLLVLVLVLLTSTATTPFPPPTIPITTSDQECGAKAYSQTPLAHPCFDPGWGLASHAFCRFGWSYRSNIDAWKTWWSVENPGWTTRIFISLDIRRQYIPLCIIYLYILYTLNIQRELIIAQNKFLVWGEGWDSSGCTGGRTLDVLVCVIFSTLKP